MLKKNRLVTKKPVPVFILSTLIGLAVFFLFIVLFSFYMTKKETPEILNTVFLLISIFAGAFVSTFLGKRKLKQQGIIPILISAVSFLLQIIIILLSVNFFSVSVLILTVLPIGFAGAFLGGLTAVKLR